MSWLSCCIARGGSVLGRAGRRLGDGCGGWGAPDPERAHLTSCLSGALGQLISGNSSSLSLFWSQLVLSPLRRAGWQADHSCCWWDRCFTPDVCFLRNSGGCSSEDGDFALVPWDIWHKAYPARLIQQSISLTTLAAGDTEARLALGTDAPVSAASLPASGLLTRPSRLQMALLAVVSRPSDCIRPELSVQGQLSPILPALFRAARWAFSGKKSCCLST